MDSFKGCLTSAEAGLAVEEGIRSVFPDCEIVRIPIADGGEGLLDVLVAATHGKYVSLQAHNPLMRMIETRYGLSDDGKTALIEMAAVSGLPLVAPEHRNPMLTTSRGTGEMIKDALRRGCRKFIIGIGGSATNDAGTGMLQALGYRFLDKEGRELGIGGQILGRVATVDASWVDPVLSKAQFTVACDVRNPFCGPEGAAYVFARQKGADDRMIEALDAGMHSFARVMEQVTGKDISGCPGAGAAGGMGGGFLAFLNAELCPGIELLLRTAGFEEQIAGADLVITGEGKADRQTAMGKVAYGVLAESGKQGIPVILLAGALEDADELNRAGFSGVFPIVPGPVSLEKAMVPEFAKENIRRVMAQLCHVMKLKKAQK